VVPPKELRPPHNFKIPSLSLGLNSSWSNRPSGTTIEREPRASSKGSRIGRRNRLATQRARDGVKRLDERRQQCARQRLASESCKLRLLKLVGEADGRLVDVVLCVSAVGQRAWADAIVAVDFALIATGD
jgi:hypothetical protein